jgi:UDP-N-acetylglucosamine acyltransferase
LPSVEGRVKSLKIHREIIFMSSNIHPTAVIAEGASLGEGCVVGPYCVVGSHVTLGTGVTLTSHVVVEGRTTLGDHVKVYPFAVIGHPPQDLKYHGEESSLEVGAHTTIREHVTLHPGTEGDRMVTKVGKHCLLMVGAHVAHDCVVGDHVILANNATLAGHVQVGDYAIIGGLSAVHQFARIGQHAIVGGMSGIEQDVIPYGSAMGERAFLGGLNLVGMKRRGKDRDAMHQLRNLYKQLFEDKDGTFQARLAAIPREGAAPEVLEVLDFLSDDSSRSICQPRMAA